MAGEGNKLETIKPTFEESLAEIDKEIYRRRSKWTLSILAWLDYDDIAQIIRIHIHKKWHLYDSTRPLAPWINRIISSQIKNLIRNNYGNYSRPCLKCAAIEGEDGCRIYHKQCNDCPLFANWEKNKKQAHDAKLPVSLENHEQEVSNMPNEYVDIEKSALNLHKKMEKILKPLEWTVYNHLFIENKDEDETARLMGYKTSEKGRQPGYKQIKNIRKSIMTKVKKVIYGGEVDIQ